MMRCSRLIERVFEGGVVDPERLRSVGVIPRKGHLVKVELALVRGKRKYDKREEIKRRELEREAKAALKRAL